MLGRIPSCKLKGEYLHTIASAIVLILTQSKTNILLVLFLFIIYVLFSISKKYKIRKSYIVVGIIALLSVFTLSNITMLSELLEATQGLTGRIPIWAYTIEKWRDNPWLGGGQDVWSSMSQQDLIFELGWAVPSAHNLVIQVLAESGIVGIVILTFWIVSYFTNVRAVPLEQRKPLMWLSAMYFLPGITDIVFSYNIGLAGTVNTWIMSTTVLLFSKVRKDAIVASSIQRI